MSTSELEISDLNLEIGGKAILRNIQLRVPRATIMALIGPSGAGKSYLLRTVNRLIDEIPSARVHGAVRLDGVDLLDRPARDVRLRVGMVFRRASVFPLSAFNNIAFGLRVRGIRHHDELEETVEWALRRVDLWGEIADRLHEPADSLPPAVRQRLCLARAIASKPDLLLLDEPTSKMDPREAAAFEEVMAGLRKDVTMLYATREPASAGRLAAVSAFLHDGRIVETGPTSELFTRPASAQARAYLRRRFG